MSTVPVGYEAFSNYRRKGVTLLSILLASSMVMGMFVYVDSYSVYEWDKQIEQVGPIAMTVSGPYVLGSVDEVRGIEGVTKAELIKGVHTELLAVNTSEQYPQQWGLWGLVQAPNQSYIEAFPTAFSFVQGRAVESEGEIAIHENTQGRFEWEIGDFINYTYFSGAGYEREREGILLEIVGIFSYFDEGYSSYDYYDYYDKPVAIVSEANLVGNDVKNRIDLEIDRSPLSPFDARASLAYAQGIAERIKELDNWYPEHRGYSQYNVNNRIANRISYFMSWVLSQRLGQLGRTSGIFVLLFLVLFLAVRHNVNERSFEMNMLMSRGASEGDLNKIIFREILVLSAVGTVLGLGVGTLFSRIASAATGFFQFNVIQILQEPLLVTIDSIIIAVIIGFILPITSYFAYRIFYKMRETVGTSTGKLAKLSKGLRLVRWDFSLFALSILLMLMVFTSDTGVQYNPLFSLILSLTPLTAFLSIGSLTIKLVRRGNRFLSKSMKRVVGEMPASIGIRRIGKSASSAGPAVLVLVLAISLAWTNSVIGASLPVTKRNHARFAFGGDLSFHLSNSHQSEWNSFSTNVSLHPHIEAVAHLSVTNLFLSAGAMDEVQVVAMNPDKFVNVGFDYTGLPLRDSSIEPMLSELGASSPGAIITEDIAESYELSIGDTLRGFTTTGEDVEQVFVFNIVGIANALTDAQHTDTGTDQDNPWWWRPTRIGANTIWVNRDYLANQFELVNNSMNILCTRVANNANTTNIAEEILSSSSNPPVESNAYASVSYEVSSYLSQTSYQIDRSIDTMLTVAVTSIILSGFVVYAFEGIRNRRREIALMRAMGANRNSVLKVQAAEMLVLMTIGLVLLFAYSPLHILNTLMTYSTTSYIFPITMYTVLPFLQMSIILIFFIAMVTVFIFIVAALGSKVNLSESLNAAWAESGIMMEGQ